MRTPAKNYRKFVYDILAQKEDIVPFIFEEINVGLTHQEFILVVYSILKQRPICKPLAKILWDYVRDTEKHVPPYIYAYAQRRWMEMTFESTTEAVILARSRNWSASKHPLYKGIIYAYNITTKKITAIISTAHLHELGFDQPQVHKCLEGKGYTHRNHVFIRDNEEL